MRAIFKRELRSYFLTMTGYIFISMFLLLAGILVWFGNIRMGRSGAAAVLGLLTNWAVFILPILTMRMFAEDRRLKTDQLLLTAPVPVRSIVLGKFFAAAVMVLCCLAVMLLYSVSFTFFGKVNWAEAASSYIGFFLLCLLVLSIGAFMSALTDSMIIAAFSTYAVLIVTVFLGNLANAFTGGLRDALLWLSPLVRFDDFGRGILDPAAIVYYISITAVFLVLTVKVIERRRFA